MHNTAGPVQEVIDLEAGEVIDEMCFHPKGALFACGTVDGVVIVVAMEPAPLIVARVALGDNSSIRALSFSRSGDSLLAATSTVVWRVHVPSGPKEARGIAGAEVVSENEDGTLTVITGTERATLERYGQNWITVGRKISTCDVPGKIVGRVSSAPDGTRFAVSSRAREGRRPTEDCWLSIYRWDGTLEYTRSFESSREYRETTHVFVGPTRLFLLRQGGADVVEMGGADGTWRAVRVRADLPISSDAVAAPDGSSFWLASGRDLYEVDAPTGAILRRIRIPIGEQLSPYATMEITAMAIDGKGRTLAVGCQDGVIRIVATQGGQQ